MKIVNVWCRDRSAAIQYQKGPIDHMWKCGFYNGRTFSPVGRIQTVELVEALKRCRGYGYEIEMKVEISRRGKMERVEKVFEDKWTVARRLEDLLKSTRQYADVESCAYYGPDEARGEDVPAGEIVVVKFTSGYRIIVNVEMDSGTALIKDVLRGLGAIK